MEQETGSKLVKENIMAIYCLLANLCSEHIIQSTRLDEPQAGIKIAGRNINNLRYTDATTSMA